MEIRFQNSPAETASMDTASLRNNFLIQKLMIADQFNSVYSHYDRMIIAGAVPVNKEINLETHTELKADYFLERREIGIINVGGDGLVTADGESIPLQKMECVYIGKGCRNVSFRSDDFSSPAVFYMLSAPAHQSHPVQKFTREQASPSEMGSQKTANRRTIYKYIHQDGIKSCQLVMGLTVLSDGSVWNTMPAHTHTRRMEAYFYFDVADDQRVFHLMGEPTQTRHLVVGNHEAIISPPWSIHSGCGTANYGFIWGMAGENYTYTDMDPASLDILQ